MEIGLGITGKKPARLFFDPPSPFESNALHPSRRALAAARQEIEKASAGLNDADVAQAVSIGMTKFLFARDAERHPKDVRFQIIDLVDFVLKLLARKIADRKSVV